VPKSFDLFTLGRCSIDLYSNDIGAPFVEIKAFGAFVGGCPTNIAVGAHRLGLRTGLLTAVGDDLVGDFVLRFLANEGVEIGFVPRKMGRRTSAVVLGIEPPDRFPLVFYREGCADIELTIDDVIAAPLDRARAVLITGTGLCREPSRSATIYAAERARGASAEVFLDVDFRADQWHDVRAFGVVLRSVLPLVDVVVGTEEELKALTMDTASRVSIVSSQVSSPQVMGDLEGALSRVLAAGPEAVALKRGRRGSTIHLRDGDVVEVAPFNVEVCNVLGAGDAFAAGFVYGRLAGWGWERSARMGNACGAIVVTRQGCANFMPTLSECLAFIEEKGGF
jgi:5-dehydro-2-deoxygluconokinase